MSYVWRWSAARVKPRELMLFAAAALVSFSADASEIKPFTTKVVKVHHEVGMASFYQLTGRTASGMTGQGVMTAAHRRLPFGSRVRVKDIKTGREVVVVITDRGPFRKSRVIDLSHQAAKQLGITSRGVAKVEVSLQ
jgi:rare lipoprotein A